MLLVVVDVAASDGRLVEMLDQRLLAQRQHCEAVRVELCHRGIVDGFEQYLRSAGDVAGSGHPGLGNLLLRPTTGGREGGDQQQGYDRG